MLRLLKSRDERFKEVEFKPGLNLLVADITKLSTRTDTMNGVGKSAMIELLHFLLGARMDTSGVLGRPEVRHIEFELQLEWPRTESLIQVRRAGDSASEVTVDPSPTSDGQVSFFPKAISLTDWQRTIERSMFALPDDHPGVSGRAMLALYIRRIKSHGFNESVKTSPQQAPSEASANVAYLLGLDWKLASRYRELAAREGTRKKLAAATKDPVWGRIVGRSAELRGQMTVARQRVLELEKQVSEFRVVPEYENLQRRADDLDQRIRRTRIDDGIDRRNLRDLVSVDLIYFTYRTPVCAAQEPDH